jgi:hypothetical protein
LHEYPASNQGLNGQAGGPPVIAGVNDSVSIANGIRSGQIRPDYYSEYGYPIYNRNPWAHLPGYEENQDIPPSPSAEEIQQQRDAALKRLLDHPEESTPEQLAALGFRGGSEQFKRVIDRMKEKASSALSARP